MRLSFDAIASQFDTQRGLPREAIRRWIQLVDELAAGRTLQVIEPGIGTGRVALPLAAMGHHLTGTDISPQMLEQCAAGAGEWPVDLHQADATDLPFDDHQFDLGIVAQLLYLVPDWPSVLDELAHVIRPGGFVIHLTEPTIENDALTRWSASWRDHIESTGYRHITIQPTDRDVRAEFLRRWPTTEQRELASWTLGQTVAEARSNYAARLRPLYGQVTDEDFAHACEAFLAWSEQAFPNPDERLDATVTFTAMIAFV